ncbi:MULTISPECIES: transcriptional regulator protein [Methanohalophilus]|nr:MULTISPECIES: transcriptional regulator protein [Methanohalophilus]KXS46596.1 MAG: transcriptional regulator protein [Methanohalophilus sp. T328-1]RSD33986.1 MAG: transcriptional regulator protein [Methanohalophilus sp.]ODV49547.1 MAG: transcriptional regulator protein [Methanohalophilus sp. 2-GBenrich]RSD34645.1 MAG: transcriptional regulator protein [Methanohalophilus sp.]RXG35061.1 transcriptional regulator protein [Methanohalophilus sp. WG1-DM]
MTRINESDEEMIEAFRGLGVSRNLATTIAYLKNVDEASSQDIEMNTGLRQPEVSVAMRSMRKNNWIEESSKKLNGKGRPTKIYSLAAPLNKIVRHFEEKVKEENDARITLVKRLRSLSKD